MRWMCDSSCDKKQSEAYFAFRNKTLFPSKWAASLAPKSEYLLAEKVQDPLGFLFNCQNWAKIKHRCPGKFNCLTSKSISSNQAILNNGTRGVYDNHIYERIQYWTDAAGICFSPSWASFFVEYLPIIKGIDIDW